MEHLAKGIVSENLNIIDSYVKKVPRVIQHKFIFILLYRLIHEEVDDKSVFNILTIFVKNKTRISLVPKISSIIKILQNKNHKIIAQYLILVIKYNRRLQRFEELVHEYGSCRSSKVVRSFRGIKSFDYYNGEIEQAHEEIFRLDHLVKSFDDRRFINFMRRPRLMKNVCLETWKEQHSQEISSRLRQMVDLFGISLLRRFKLKIMLQEDFWSISFAEQIQYFSQCCIQLRIVINNLKNLLLKIGILTMELDEMHSTYGIQNFQEEQNSEDIYSDSDDEDIEKDADESCDLDKEISQDNQMSSLINDFFKSPPQNSVSTVRKPLNRPSGKDKKKQTETITKKIIPEKQNLQEKIIKIKKPKTEPISKSIKTDDERKQKEEKLKKVSEPHSPEEKTDDFSPMTMSRELVKSVIDSALEQATKVEKIPK